MTETTVYIINQHDHGMIARTLLCENNLLYVNPERAWIEDIVVAWCEVVYVCHREEAVSPWLCPSQLGPGPDDLPLTIGRRRSVPRLASHCFALPSPALAPTPRAPHIIWEEAASPFKHCRLPAAHRSADFLLA